jgi:hypothetical protein
MEKSSPMANKIPCPTCKVSLQLSDGLAGKKVKCPKCGNAFLVPKPPEEEEATEVDPIDDEDEVEGVDEVEEAPRRKGKAQHAEEEDEEEEAPRRKSKSRRVEEEEEEEEEERPARKNKRQKAKEGKSRWEPCPRCGDERARRVLWTFWGSFYGPAIFSHVQCQECGTTYNGRTGRSNLIPAIICFTIPLVLIMGLIGFILYILRLREII